MKRKIAFWDVRHSLRKGLLVFDLVINFERDGMPQYKGILGFLCERVRITRNYTPKISVFRVGRAQRGACRKCASPLPWESPIWMSSLLGQTLHHSPWILQHSYIINIFLSLSVSILTHFLKACTALFPRIVLLHVLHKSWMIPLNGQDWKLGRWPSHLLTVSRLVAHALH